MTNGLRAPGESWSELCARISILAVIAGALLVIAPGIVLQYDVTPKLSILLLSTAALLFCWRAWWPGAVTLLQTSQGRVFAGLTALQFLSLIISTVFSRHPALSLAGSAWHRYGVITQISLVLFAFLTATYIIARRERVAQIVLALVCCSGVVSAYAIAQYAGWDPLLDRSLYTTSYFGTMIRPPSTLGNAVYLGGFLAAAIPLNVALLGRASGKKRFAFLFLVVLSLIALLLTGSRAALLSLVAAALIHFPNRRRIPKVNILETAGACTIVGLTLLLFLNLNVGASFRLRIAQWRQDFWGGPRLLVWRDSLPLVSASLPAGMGPEAFANEFRLRQSAELSQAYPEHYQESPHNFLLDALLSQGLPGLLWPMGLAYLAFSSRSNGEIISWGLCSSASASLITLCFQTVTVSGAMMLYLSVALIVSVRETRAASIAAGPKFWVKLVAAGLAVVFLTAAAAYFVQDRIFAKIADSAGAREFDRMANLYQSAVDMRFPPNGDDLWCSRQFASLARISSGEAAQKAWTMAAMASARAERTSDTAAEAAYQSAVLALGQNDAANGERKLRQAIDAAPNWYKPHLMLAQLLRVTGRLPESEPEARRALELSGKLRSEIQRVLGTRLSE